MPWIGLRDGARVIPEAIDDGTAVECIECGGTMYPRPKRDTESETARHFWHPGGSVGCAAVSGGESDEHRKLKSIAVSELRRIFDGQYSECLPERVIKTDTDSDAERRVADAFLEFESWDNQLGNGLIVEVQYRNKGKDIEATTADYLAQDYAVVWVYEEDFSEDRLLLDELDLRRRAEDAVWPHHVPNNHRWQSPEHAFDRIQQRWFVAYESGLSVSGAPATLPPDFVDEQALQLWRAQEWERLFTPSEMPSFVAEAMAQPGVRMSTEVRFPPEFVDTVAKRVYRETEWMDLFTGSKDHLSHARWEWTVKNEVWDPSTAYPVSFRLAKWLHDANSVLRVHFRRKKTEKLNSEQALARSLRLLFEKDWEPEKAINTVFEEYTQQIEPIDLQGLERRTLLNEITTFALVPRSNETEYRRSVQDFQNTLSTLEYSDPIKPPNPFDDVQCRQCGKYWHVSKQHERCPNCDLKVDVEWNLSTGRVSSRDLF